MATRSRTAARTAKSGAGLTKADLLDMYRLILLSRRLDDKEIQLKRQNKIFFQISGAGPQAAPLPAGRKLPPPPRSVFSPSPHPRAPPPPPLATPPTAPPPAGGG